MKILPCLLLLLGIATQLQATRLFVRPAGSGDGSSWTAATSLQRALRQARPGDEIWVATGTYLTSRAGDRTATFSIPAGVRVYGGFTGRETDLTERPQGSRSILSGEIGEANVADDNAYTVVEVLAAPGRSSQLDGFRITGGRGRGYRKHYDPTNTGGGIFLHAVAGGHTTHLVKNCVITNNHAHNGGAVYVAGGSPVFLNCRFSGNDADFYGGAVYSSGRRTEAAPTFQQCVFTDNASSSGAGLTNDATNNSSSPVLVGCTFTDNVSLVNGAAIFNIQRAGGYCDLTVENCTIDGNLSIINRDIAGFGGPSGHIYTRRTDRSAAAREATAKRRR